MHTRFTIAGVVFYIAVSLTLAQFTPEDCNYDLSPNNQYFGEELRKFCQNPFNVFSLEKDDVSKPTLHSFGDSHSSWGMETLFRPISEVVNLDLKWMGAITMFRVGRDGMSFLDIKKMTPFNHCDIAAFSFGEIDVRNHVIRYGYANFMSTLRKLVKSYAPVIQQNSNGVPSVGILLWGISPTVDIDTYGPRGQLPEVLGRDYERTIMTLAINNMLRNVARSRGWMFYDRYHEYASQRGTLRMEVSDGLTHVMHYNKNSQNRLTRMVQRHSKRCYNARMV